ncbi:hypothetical protein CspHIS471_0206950 [Cutaneotrichosporon sp. HIS471]|nr:hypothetical protein CspHIS471_0206950 [Cutaneotrichosporon sp. HIS471]
MKYLLDGSAWGCYPYTRVQGHPRRLLQQLWRENREERVKVQNVLFNPWVLRPYQLNHVHGNTWDEALHLRGYLPSSGPYVEWDGVVKGKRVQIGNLDPPQSRDYTETNLYLYLPPTNAFEEVQNCLKAKGAEVTGTYDVDKHDGIRFGSILHWRSFWLILVSGLASYSVKPLA